MHVNVNMFIYSTNYKYKLFYEISVHEKDLDNNIIFALYYHGHFRFK